MQIGSYRFDRVEFAGSLGDFGTLIPLSIALVTINGLSFTSVFLLVGLFYFAIGNAVTGIVVSRPLKRGKIEILRSIRI